MKGLNIPAKEKSPKVILDPEKKIFEMEGNSRPENVREFYYPIIDTLRKYFEKVVDKGDLESYNETPFNFTFKLDYFNSASAKFISDILVIIKDFIDEKLIIKVNWYFEDGDDDMKEVGEDFSEMISLPFNSIMIQRN
jgi:SiaC family regulatory phosphoprotein